jgi:hypothetical protein
VNPGLAVRGGRQVVDSLATLFDIERKTLRFFIVIDREHVDDIDGFSSY